MNSEWFGGGDRVKSQKNFKLTLFGKFMQITIWEMNERCAFIYLGGGAVKNGSVGFCSMIVKDVWFYISM